MRILHTSDWHLGRSLHGQSLLEGQAAYYSVMRIRNEGKEPLAINLARHNTLGSPFL